MKKKHGKAKSVLKKIAWFNKRPLPQVGFFYILCDPLPRPCILFPHSVLKLINNSIKILPMKSPLCTKSYNLIPPWNPS